MGVLSSALSSGNDVKLSANIDLTETLSVAADKEVELDLNGKTITATGDVIPFTVENGATLTIKNGNISSESDVVVIGEGATLKIESGATLKTKGDKGRINNTALGKFEGNKDDYIIYHEITSGDFDNFIGLQTSLPNLNTIVITGTFTVNNVELLTKLGSKDAADAYFNTASVGSFGNTIRRIELTNGSVLDVTANVGEANNTSIGFNEIYVSGNASIISTESYAEQSSIVYLQKDADITLEQGAVLTLNNVDVRISKDPESSSEVPEIKGNGTLVKQGDTKIDSKIYIQSGILN